MSTACAAESIWIATPAPGANPLAMTRTWVPTHGDATDTVTFPPSVVTGPVSVVVGVGGRLPAAAFAA
jgi:hypothetical protein